MRLPKKLKKSWLVGIIIFLALLCSWQIISGILYNQLQAAYEQEQSQVFTDRNGKLIQIEPNSRGYFDQFLSQAPPRFKDLLLKKEDRFFYWHFGFNPISVVRDISVRVFYGKRTGSSTLTQQLAKTLLANENDRSWKNKIKEFFYAESLEWRTSKNNILLMYLNSAYFGSQAQGLKQASLDYFNVPPESLNDAQILSLLATLNNPSNTKPNSGQNIKQAKALASAFHLDIADEDWKNLTLATDGQNTHTSETAFEVNSLNLNCAKNCQLTLDSALSENIRQILKRNLTSAALDTAQNGAVVVIKLPENEIVSLVGSPDPSSSGYGMQLNMATKPRPIGSTSKPFIYMNAFEKGARPYSLVSDEEIKYEIGTGFDFFPKNFDGKFRGTVTLHQALDNSLNIPSVQVLEFVGLENFYNFMQKELGFRGLQPLANYQLGIALGGLEVDPLTLSYYFTLFPQQGVLKPLTIYKSGSSYKVPMADEISTPKQVGNVADVELVNRILNDRDTGVDQFGIKSSLNLPYTNYGLKTGTSRDYHDSWTVGYTPDFLVGVWVGNADNKAMRQITGLAGAARIWHEVMLNLYNSDYNKNTPFKFDKVQEVQVGNTLDFALQNDDIKTAQNIMLRTNLILNPHDGDKFLLQAGTTIPLSASTDATWTVNGKVFGKGQKLDWPAKAAGEYTIVAETADGKKEQVTIYINKE